MSKFKALSKHERGMIQKAMPMAMAWHQHQQEVNDTDDIGLMLNNR